MLSDPWIIRFCRGTKPKFSMAKFEPYEGRDEDMALNPEKAKAIELAMTAVERQFGKGSIMRLGNDEPLNKDVQVVPTGSISLDIALGVGGYPRGRIIEVFGPESSGKTTVCLHAV